MAVSGYYTLDMQCDNKDVCAKAPASQTIDGTAYRAVDGTMFVGKTRHQALRLARKAGWKRRGVNAVICPACSTLETK